MNIFRFALFTIMLVVMWAGVCAQDYFIPINREWNLRYEPFLQTTKSNKVHTSIKPYRHDEIIAVANIDSIDTANFPINRFSKTLVGRKIFKEHLVQIKDDDFLIHADFIFEGRLGKDLPETETLFTNSRGFWLGGTAGKRFSFSTTFFENQARFPAYIDTFVTRFNIIPGEGRIKKQYGSYDYSNVTGTISYTINRHFNVQFGHDKNFIGDGYRSLLLSDNANSYPFLKISTTAWKVKYVNLFTVLTDLQFPAPNDIAFKKKYASFHYLDLNIGKHASIGILESVVWSGDSARGQGFDINYMNPFVFIRPVEFSIGSPDNMMLGFNLKVKLFSKLVFYGQLMLDEFKLSEIRDGNGWFANKQAFQLGLKSYDLPIKNLDVLTEFNYVRPFTYSHRTTFTNYAHFNQSLAHPLGSNFIESVSLINYRYKNYIFRFQFNYAETASDTGNSNLGNDIFKNYETYTFAYGNRMLQGQRHNLIYSDIRAGYVINQRTNLCFELGYTYRRMTTSGEVATTNWVYASIRTALFNRYHDF
ncbi:MAG TPA: hypothetical protein PKC85_03685 [Bacteroidia bacterium]|jgi:hypothetical protein|nr:hypothetical protein [Bacteroidia bacterium]HMU18927.1 hypothetical protein [Bacteroidia bacterium]